MYELEIYQAPCQLRFVSKYAFRHFKYHKIISAFTGCALPAPRLFPC